MTIEAWGDRLAPDIPETLRRFPLPIALAAAATLCILALTNQIVPFGDEGWMRGVLGLGTGAVFALAGVFFGESRPGNRLASIILAYVVPIAVVLLFQLRDTTYFVPYAMPVVGALWLSVSASTAGWGRGAAAGQQDRFWWLNHRAAASGAIAGVALLLITVGIVAIERTVATLFGFELGNVFYRTVLPILGAFFAPLYWLSTLPRLSEYDPRVLEQPDFLARAIGLLGKFVLIPLLLAYSVILLAYFAQIVLTRSLPQGVLGWMVLGFVIAGAATWLVLHPPFVRDSALVRFFHRGWFWLTILPLGLFGLAVYIRIDAYGFTPERLLLVWGGIWAGVITLTFLFRRGDIRMIPGLAAFLLLIGSIGPWNIENLPRVQQAMVLDDLLSRPGTDAASVPTTAEWPAEDKSRAVAVITYLGGDDQGQVELARVLRAHGIEVDAAGVDAGSAVAALGLQGTGELIVGTAYSLGRDFKLPVDVSATPWLIGDAYVSGSDSRIAAVDLTFRIDRRTFVALRGGRLMASVDLGPMIDGDNRGMLPVTTIDFTVGDRKFRLVVDLASVHRGMETNNQVYVGYVDGVLFSSAPAD